MDIEIYCDESRQDLFTTRSTTAGSFFLVGGVWIESSKRTTVKLRLLEARKRHGVYGEVKWSKVSAGKIAFYEELVGIFFTEEVRFRCVVVNREYISRDKIAKYHSADAELGFYKFYYQLIHHWLVEFNSYSIYLDAKSNRLSSRLHSLREVLQNSRVVAKVKFVQALPSKESQLIQLADLLVGAVGARLNDTCHGGAKGRLLGCIEGHLGHEVQETLPSEQKFNVFRIRPRALW